MGKYQFLIFDLDNTVFDFWAAEKYALTRIFREDGLEMTDEVMETYRSFNKELWKQYEDGHITQTYLNEERFVRLFHHYGIEVSGQMAEQKFRKYLAVANCMMPDAIEILQQLKKDYHLLAATNGIAQTQYLRLETAGIANLFEELYISEEVGARKPSEEFFTKVLQTSGMTKENALMIGDSFKADIYGANRMGIDTCWYTLDGIKPTEPIELEEVEATYQINHLEQLVMILENTKV